MVLLFYGQFQCYVNLSCYSWTLCCLTISILHLPIILLLHCTVRGFLVVLCTFHQFFFVFLSWINFELCHVHLITDFALAIDTVVSCCLRSLRIKRNERKWKRIYDEKNHLKENESVLIEFERLNYSDHTLLDSKISKWYPLWTLSQFGTQFRLLHQCSTYYLTPLSWLTSDLLLCVK